MRKYVEPSVSIVNLTMDHTLGHKLWVESRKHVISEVTEKTMKVGNEVVELKDYFTRVLKQGLQYNNFPFFIFHIHGSNLFRDLSFNVNKASQWSISQRFVNSTFTEFHEHQYPISAEYEGRKIWEDQFTKYMELIKTTKITDYNRLEAPHSLSCEFWVGMNLKTLIAFVSALKIKMPAFYNTYGVQMLDSVKSDFGLDLIPFLVPYIDDSISQYFSRTEFKESYQEVDDMVILKKKMGLLVFAQFLRQSDVIIKGFWDELVHEDPEEFLNGKLFYAGTELKITYIADKNKFMRTAINRNCWFSQSDGNGINSWSPITEVINKSITTNEQFIGMLPCGFKKLENGKHQLCKCSYKEDTKFRQEGIEVMNLPCSIFMNSKELAQQRFDASPGELNQKYINLMEELVPHTL